MSIPNDKISKLDAIIQDLLNEFVSANKARFTSCVNKLFNQYGKRKTRKLLYCLLDFYTLQYLNHKALIWAKRRVTPELGAYWEEKSGVYGWYKKSQYLAVRIPLKIVTTDDPFFEFTVVNFYGFHKEAVFWILEGFCPSTKIPFSREKDDVGFEYIKVDFNLPEEGFYRAAKYFEGCGKWYRQHYSSYYVKDCDEYKHKLRKSRYYFP